MIVGKLRSCFRAQSSVLRTYNHGTTTKTDSPGCLSWTKTTLGGWCPLERNARNGEINALEGQEHAGTPTWQGHLLNWELFRLKFSSDIFILRQNFRHFCLKCLQTFWLKTKLQTFTSYNLLDLKMVLQTFCLPSDIFT
jgi:hypothetical protein